MVSPSSGPFGEGQTHTLSRLNHAVTPRTRSTCPWGGVKEEEAGKEGSIKIYSDSCTMAHVGNGAAGEDEECFEDAFERIPVAGQMDLCTAIQETQCALNLVLNNKFNEALELLKPWYRDSMYHALGYSSILVMKAAMTFEHQDIQVAMATIKDALNTCQKFRKRSSVVGSLSKLVSMQSHGGAPEEEIHAELCYAECLLQKATLTFVQDENMISFIKGGIKIRTSYQIYKECQNMLNANQDQAASSDSFTQFEGGVKLGIGSFNLMLSLLPQRILRLLEFIGFSGNRNFGLSQLMEGSANHSLRSILSALTLLFYHTYVSLILGTGEGDLVEAEALLEPYQQKYPKGSIILFYTARISALRGDFEQAQSRYEECLAAQNEWLQIHHLCYWELMWCHSYRQQWQQAYTYADLLCKESRWSKRQIRYDHYLVPFSLYELGLLYKQQGDIAKATSYIENAKSNYKDYSMESRLHFRIHAALNSLRGTPVSTP
ncbi:unnamed protein product [Arctogadus glacialis]